MNSENRLRLILGEGRREVAKPETVARRREREKGETKEKGEEEEEEEVEEVV